MAQGVFSRRRPRQYDGTSAAEVAVFDATEKLLAETSLQELTVAQILENAKLSRANFYHYFPNKYSVVVALLSKLVGQSYSEAAPWDSAPGRIRVHTMGETLARTLDMWSAHGPMIFAVIEHMHTQPTIAEAWRYTFARFVDSVAEQIAHERAVGAAPAGSDARMLAYLLVSAVERVFYVSSRGLDPVLQDPGDVIAPLAALHQAVVYGDPRGGGNVAATRTRATPAMAPPAPPTTPQPDLDTETARVLLGAMAELLDGMSLADISVAKVIERAGTSRASFYFYFRSKEDAFVALFRSAASQVVDDVAALGTVPLNGPEDFVQLMRTWLAHDVLRGPIVRNAVHDWPRLPELRAAYLEVIAAVEEAIAVLISDARGDADEGMPPAAQYAATLVWAIERTVAGSLAGEDHLADVDAVAEMLGRVVHSAVVGRR
ncbi:TetR/AcrR family transcriptional regulator [Tsukamurella sp. 8F]|uniref:TetR/AcrR family transcriptional regulator n=1 Tax=unclassified Tsukamurella TaxID=2633480 RepID=UPI0023B9CFB6|nr:MULTISPECIES: TetR/AcrR family transcriptional regulator [unclassified Tsukamurella]MDF0529670.1 TetR/AcrR family transcriptional regulator [Tsukamurella sp. 8J]MDF0585955.1 TetR/AcrR family transcriptional regulator [Tsukamurella sp. 8F]